MATPERASGLLASRLLLVGSARVVVAGSGLGFSLVAARVLGPGATGTLYVAISLVVGISLFARMGNDINLIWQANRAQEQLSGPALGRLLVASMAIGCALCVAIGAALKAGASQGVYPGITRAQGEMLIALFLLAPALTVSGLVAAVLKGGGFGARAAILEQGAIFVYALPLLAAWLLLSSDLGARAFGDALRVGALCMVALGIFWCLAFLRRQPTSAQAGEGPGLGAFLRSSLTMGGANLAAYLIHWGPLVIVGALAGEAESGYYAVAERIAVIGLFPLSVVNIVFAHQLATFDRQGDEAGLLRAARLSCGLAALGALPVAIVCIGFGEVFARQLDPRFLAMVPAMALLSVAFLFPALTGAGSYLLMLRGRGRALNHILWGTLALQLVAVGLVAPRYGAVGAAAVVLLVNGARYLLIQYQVARTLGGPLLPLLALRERVNG